MTKWFQRLSFVALSGMAGAAMWFGASSPGLDPIDPPRGPLPDGVYDSTEPGLWSREGKQIGLPILRSRAGVDFQVIIGKSNIIRAAVREFRSEK